MLSAEGALIAYSRYNENDEIVVIANAARTKADYELEGEWKNLLNGRAYTGSVAPTSCVILKRI